MNNADVKQTVKLATWEASTFHNMFLTELVTQALAAQSEKKRFDYDAVQAAIWPSLAKAVVEFACTQRERLKQFHDEIEIAYAEAIKEPEWKA